MCNYYSFTLSADQNFVLVLICLSSIWKCWFFFFCSNNFVIFSFFLFHQFAMKFGNSNLSRIEMCEITFQPTSKISRFTGTRIQWKSWQTGNPCSRTSNERTLLKWWLVSSSRYLWLFAVHCSDPEHESPIYLSRLYVITINPIRFLIRLLYVTRWNISKNTFFYRHFIFKQSRNRIGWKTPLLK